MRAKQRTRKSDRALRTLVLATLPETFTPESDHHWSTTTVLVETSVESEKECFCDSRGNIFTVTLPKENIHGADGGTETFFGLVIKSPFQRNYATWATKLCNIADDWGEEAGTCFILLWKEIQLPFHDILQLAECGDSVATYMYAIHSCSNHSSHGNVDLICRLPTQTSSLFDPFHKWMEFLWCRKIKKPSAHINLWTIRYVMLLMASLVPIFIIPSQIKVYEKMCEQCISPL